MKKLIKNVVSLNMAKATPESVKRITNGNTARVIENDLLYLMTRFPMPVVDLKRQHSIKLR